MQIIIDKYEYDSLVKELEDYKRIIDDVKQQDNVIIFTNRHVYKTPPFEYNYLNCTNRGYDLIVCAKGHDLIKQEVDIVIDKNDKVLNERIKELELIVNTYRGKISWLETNIDDIMSKKWWKKLFN
jgi:hypothetical protein